MAKKKKRLTTKGSRFKITKESLEDAKELEDLVFEYQKTKSSECLQEIKYYINYQLDRIIYGLEKRFNKTNLHSLDVEKIVDRTLRERILAYSPRNKKSQFRGYIGEFLYWYSVTNARKEIRRQRDPNKRFNAKRCFPSPRYNKQFEDILKNFPKRQQAVMREYYQKCYTHKRIANNLNIAGSTVRNAKMIALRKVKKVNPTIYKKLIDQG